MKLRYWLKIILITLSIILFLSYLGFNLYKLVRGPSISISLPLNMETDSDITELVGSSKADHVYILDREIYTDINGSFKEKIITTDKYNKIKIRAVNRFGFESDLNLLIKNINK